MSLQDDVMSAMKVAIKEKNQTALDLGFEAEEGDTAAAKAE